MTQPRLQRPSRPLLTFSLALMTLWPTLALADGTRRIEGVWQGQPRTWDMRGKRFAIVMAGNPYTESGDVFRIPDMLANRADIYNLGDTLGGMQEAFALSYIENSLTSNPVLAPLATRDMADVYRFVAKAEIGLRLMRYGALRMLSNTSHSQIDGAALTYKIQWATWRRGLGELAMDVLGQAGEVAEGVDYEWDTLPNLFLYSRADTIYGGTNQIQRNMIAERALGMPREPRGGST